VSESIRILIVDGRPLFLGWLVATIWADDELDAVPGRRDVSGRR
jgi:hypothetical protein